MILRPGTYLQNRYEIIERIGSGGMSDVYKAMCHKLNRLVAIKVLKDEFCEDAGFVGKFKREAQAAAGLSHHNIVNVYDVVDEGELHYIVMELIEGITLKNYISSKKHLEIRESIGIALQVAQGIGAAHERHIVHRDIKPQNMIISKDGKVKVADFGIARAVSEQTLSADAIGSVHYISPEQAKGGLSDERSDIYSLGITMYEMLTGKLPFEGDSTVAIALAHLEESITPPSIYNRDIPPALERIVLKCTNKRPEARYQSIFELIPDLRRVLSNPDADIAAEADDSATKIIGSGEVELINSVNARKKRENPKGAEKSQPKKPDKTDSDKAEKMDRIVTITGVVIALLLVSGIVFAFSKLSGISVFSTQESTAATEASELDSTQVYMPGVLNLSQELAEERLKSASLQMKIAESRHSDTVPEGCIIEQSPKEGEIVSKYSNAEVVVSLGTDKTDLSGLGITGMNTESAKKLLEERGFSVVVNEQFSETVEAGNIISFSPEKPVRGGRVELNSSKGREQKLKPVPKLTMLSEEEAVAAIIEAGFTVGTAGEENSDTVAKGLIISQIPAFGAQLAEGSAISYTISKGAVAENKNYKYIASIDMTYNISDLIGPGSATTSVSIMVRLRQNVGGNTVYTTLMEPRKVNGDTILPVRFKSIEGAYGVDQGEVEVVEADTDTVLKSYTVEFFKVE